MKTKITMNRTENKTFSEFFELFTKSRIAKGVSDITIRNIEELYTALTVASSAYRGFCRDIFSP